MFIVAFSNIAQKKCFWLWILVPFVAEFKTDLPPSFAGQ
jgi:hypothetical protein